MKPRRWQRIAARIVLVTFTTCFTACGGAQSEPPAATTSTTPLVPTTIAAPTTLPPDPPPSEPPAPPPAQPPPTLPAQPPDQLNKQELRDLVAPVALYPDVVLASLLPATTNPDQLHDAAQYVGTAQHVDTIPEDRGWDGSVVGLLQFPDVLRWLDQNPAWTDQMGQAVTYQQGDVLQAIQDYRHAVQNVGNLKSNQYQTVRGTPSEDIRIEPARPDVVYVPSYDPVVATQPQPVQASPGINPWLAFGGGAVVGALGAWALYSIFDDDDHDHHHDNYYRGGRRIRGYNDYYYARARRPPAVEWTPRPRPRRAVAQGWQHPRRLEYHGQQVQAGRKTGAALRPPRVTSAQQPSRPDKVRREQQQQRPQAKPGNRQQGQPQRQERTQQQRNQGQKRKQAQPQQKQMKQQRQGQRREKQQDQRPKQRQQQQEHQQQRREQPKAQQHQQQKKNQQKKNQQQQKGQKKKKQKENQQQQ